MLLPGLTPLVRRLLGVRIDQYGCRLNNIRRRIVGTVTSALMVNPISLADGADDMFASGNDTDAKNKVIGYQNSNRREAGPKIPCYNKEV